MNLPSIIGIIGEKGSGKDTLYRVALAELGYERVSLAAPLKAMVCNELHAEGMAFADAWADVHVVKSERARHLLQKRGDELRAVDPGYFAAIALTTIRAIVKAGGRAAVTDVRYPNEAAALTANAHWLAADYAKLNSHSYDFQVRRWRMTRCWADEGHGGVTGLLPTPEHTALLVKVVRPGLARDGLSEHQSETSARDLEGHTTIYNISSVADLKESVRNVLMERAA